MNLMDDIEDADDDIDIYKLAFIGSNKEKFNFNTFDMPLNFLLNIYNAKISLKKQNLNKKKQKKIQKSYNLTINQKIKIKNKK